MTDLIDEKSICILRYCSFCAKNENEVCKLIAGPIVFICDECISLSVGIINAHDKTFFTKIKKQLLEDKQMLKQVMKTIDDAPDEFWDLMDQENIYSKMAAAVLEVDKDLTEHLSERAYNLISKSRLAGNMAWKIIHEKYPETVNHQMSAAPGCRKVSVFQ